MPASVTTRSYDHARTGANNSETVLTATAVRNRGIVKLFSLPIPDDPRLEAQPLAVGGVHIADGTTRDLIFQASMGNWVYAFDALTGEKIWATDSRASDRRNEGDRRTYDQRPLGHLSTP